MGLVIKKAKTKTSEVWSLLVNGNVVGTAKAVHKTATQRTWGGDVRIPLIDNDAYFNASVADLRSAKAVMIAIAVAFGDREALAQSNVAAPVQAPKPLLRSDITAATAIELSKLHGHDVNTKAGVERTGAAQAKYLRRLLDRKAAAPKTAMSDLVGTVNSVVQVTPMGLHFGDK